MSNFFLVTFAILVSFFSGTVTAQTSFDRRKAEKQFQNKAQRLQEENSKKKANKKTDDDPLTPTTLQCIKVEVGFKGELGWQAFKILQVIDKNNAIGEIIVDSNNKQIVWFKIDTTDMTDDHRYTTGNQWFEATGTKQYESALGSKTVIVMKPTTNLNEEKKKAKEKLKAENEVQAQKILQEKDRLRKAEANRTWTNKIDKWTIKAEFVGSIAEKVKLKKEDGSIMTVPIENLSKEDQIWLRNRAKGK
jgi:hypothetical protein